MSRYDLTWTRGTPPPADEYASWGEWIRAATESAVESCTDHATRPNRDVRINPATGYASLGDVDALRPIPLAIVRRATYRAVHGYLEERCLLAQVDWRAVLEQVQARVASRLEARGYTLESA